MNEAIECIVVFKHRIHLWGVVVPTYRKLILTVGFGDALQLIFLLDGVRIA